MCRPICFFFPLIFIMQWFHLGCLWCGCGCIQVAWVGSWGRNLICISSWIWLLLWIWCCWRVFWKPAYRLWAWILLLGSLFGIRLLWILSYYFPFSLVARCRWIFCMSSLSWYCLGFPFFWWMWFCWLGFYSTIDFICEASKFILRRYDPFFLFFGFLINFL